MFSESLGFYSSNADEEPGIVQDIAKCHLLFDELPSRKEVVIS